MDFKYGACEMCIGHRKCKVFFRTLHLLINTLLLAVGCIFRVSDLMCFGPYFESSLKYNRNSLLVNLKFMTITELFYLLNSNWVVPFLIKHCEWLYNHIIRWLFLFFFYCVTLQNDGMVLPTEKVGLEPWQLNLTSVRSVLALKPRVASLTLATANH